MLPCAAAACSEAWHYGARVGCWLFRLMGHWDRENVPSSSLLHLSPAFQCSVLLFFTLLALPTSPGPPSISSRPPLPCRGLVAAFAAAPGVSLSRCAPQLRFQHEFEDMLAAVALGEGDRWEYRVKGRLTGRWARLVIGGRASCTQARGWAMVVR